MAQSHFSDWQTETWVCQRCQWSGSTSEASMEPFDELFEINCPKCEGRLAVIAYATEAEVREQAKAGNPEAIEMMPWAEAVERKRTTKEECRRLLTTLPDFDGATLSFTFEGDGGHDPMSPEWLVLKHQGTEVYREPSGFEAWRAIVDISSELRRRYGSRLAWVDPGEVGYALQGDDISANLSIERHLAAARLCPPTGSWSR